MNLQTAKSLESHIKATASNGKNIFASVMTVTEPKMVVKDRTTKEPNPYLGKVKKITHTVLSIGNNYESAVNNRLTKEGKENDFVAQGITGRVHISDMILESVKDPNQHYLEVFAMTNTPPKVEYRMDDGTIVPIEKIKPFLPVVKENEGQGLDNPVKVLSYKLESIVEVKIGDYKFD